MSEELPTVDLREYIGKVRKTFQVEPYASIDYQTIECLPTEMERREATLSYFIPDIFEIGKYDRRMDIIDGCIYCLEVLEGSKYATLVRNMWAHRAGVDSRLIYKPADNEEDSYGHIYYHPILSVVSDPKRPKVWIGVLIRLVQYLQCFRDHRRRLTLNDYTLIYFSIYHSAAKHNVAKSLSMKLYSFLEVFENKIHEIPLKEGIDVTYFMKSTGFKSPMRLLTEFHDASVRILSIFERSTFGLESFLFHCPRPYHVRVYTSQGWQNQAFLTGGFDMIQEIYTNIPRGSDWKRLYQKFTPETRCYRVTQLRLLKHSFRRYLDPSVGTWWWNYPWDRIQAEWTAFQEGDCPTTAIQPHYDVIEPTLELMKVCVLLEEDGNMRNANIERSTQIPSQRVSQLRAELDKALVQRTLIAQVPELTDFTVITVDGREKWKFNLLELLGELSPIAYVTLLQDMNSADYFLQGTYLLTPEAAVPFCKTFINVFHGHLHYTLHKRLRLGHPRLPWYERVFDPARGWVWDPEDYTVEKIADPH
jgi:hypothetical protein